jgi:hypothetical protein
MKTRTILVLFVILISQVWNLKAQSSDQKSKDQIISADKVEVYYFHFERRCATCMAVESESEKILNELYPEKMKSGEITFLSVNLEEKSNEPLAEKLKVDGQTLLVVKGDKQDNLTNQAFMYVSTNRDKLKKTIQQSIEKL